VGIPLHEAIEQFPELAALPGRHAWRWYTVPDDRGGTAALVGEHVPGHGYVEAMYVYSYGLAAVVRVRTDPEGAHAVWNHCGSLGDVIAHLAALGEAPEIAGAPRPPVVGRAVPAPGPAPEPAASPAAPA
jgi:hypothetical protein